MASEKQIEANRRNSKKSTGPATEEGKARSSQNAFKHGMYSKDILLFHEDFDGYEELRRQLFLDQEPETAAEFILIEQALQSYFLARRALFMMADADNHSTHGGKPTVITYPILVKIKNQNDRTAFKALEALRQIKNDRARLAAAAPKPPKTKQVPKTGFVPPEYPDAPGYLREVPWSPS